MEITKVKDSTVKIKTKTGAVLLTPAQLQMVHKKAETEDFVVTGPGEYEVEGISVFGYQSGSQVIYVIQADELRVLYLGALSEAIAEKTMGELENIDVVIFDMGEGVGSKELSDLVAKLEPYYVIPLGEGSDGFITSYEHGSRAVKSLNLNRLSLSDEVTEVITFE